MPCMVSLQRPLDLSAMNALKNGAACARGGRGIDVGSCAGYRPSTPEGFDVARELAQTE
jgi:hypothetical protein